MIQHYGDKNSSSSYILNIQCSSLEIQSSRIVHPTINTFYITVWYKIRNTTINIWPIFIPRTTFNLIFKSKISKVFTTDRSTVFNANLKTLLTITFSLLIILQIHFISLFSNVISNGKQFVMTGNKWQWVRLCNFKTFLIAFLHVT